MSVVALGEVEFWGLQPKRFHHKILLWLFVTLIWTPLRWLGIKAWHKVTHDSPKGFIAKNMFDGTTRHCFIMAGSDFGKSSLIKEAVADQISDVFKGKSSMFIMDGTELIDEVVTKFNPTDKQIRERMVLIDPLQAGGPNDIGSMPRLNMLNTGAGQPNSHIAMTAKSSIFEMVFGSLLEGNEQSGPMSTMLSFASKTLAHVKNPSPNDFIELLRDPFSFTKRMDGLPPLVLDYWRDEIKTKPMRDGREVIGHEVIPNMTAQALSRRAYQMIANPVIERLLCNPVETVNLAEKLNQGCFVGVATRTGPATAGGARHIGRFMLAMLLRAAKSRNSLGGLMPTSVIIDEIPNYMSGGRDESLIGLLSEARKFGMSINLICQEEGQTAPAMLSSVIANCGTLIVGGISRQVAERVRFPMGIKANESGPDKGKLNVDILALKPKNFAACVKGHDPIVIKSKKDALGDNFRRIPKGAKGEAMVAQTMQRVHQIMRELYAHDPVEQAIDDAPNVERFEGVRPI